MQTKTPLITIIITNYNYSKYVSRSIRSCLHQSLSELIEVIVIDDCSTDNSVKVIDDNFSSEEIVKIFLDQNQGVAYCSNLGIKKASGMYVMRVDADDYIHSKMVEYLFEFLNMNNEYAFSYCDHIRVNENEVKSERIYLNNEKALLDHGAGILFKKSHLEAIGLYDEEMLNCEDMLLLKKLMQNNFHGIYVQLPLYRYYRHDNNMTNNIEEREKWTNE
ncbi:MAG: glycosyltransferase family 2 protein, partial [Epsilonproteobacteria bacterium]|nr:glycosyltransferase family 2 protein [Campylobacterota bacterium]